MNYQIILRFLNKTFFLNVFSFTVMNDDVPRSAFFLCGTHNKTKRREKKERGKSRNTDIVRTLDYIIFVATIFLVPIVHTYPKKY